MSAFDSDGVRIVYEVEGEGPPIVLVHGFAANITVNWKRTRWFDALTGAGRRVIALDCRGHGASEKPHDPDAYAGDRMPGDVVRLMDHLGLERADLMGYSMGGLIATQLLVHHPDRFRSVVLAGVGGAMGRSRFDRTKIANGLSLPADVPIRSATAQAFRSFAERIGNDLVALAAVMHSLRQAVTAEELGRVDKPVLIVVGEEDNVAGDPRDLAEAIPSARLVLIPGKDHLTAVPDRLYKRAVIDFLSEQAPGDGSGF